MNKWILEPLVLTFFFVSVLYELKNFTLCHPKPIRLVINFLLEAFSASRQGWVTLVVSVRILLPRVISLPLVKTSSLGGMRFFFCLLSLCPACPCLGPFRLNRSEALNWIPGHYLLAPRTLGRKKAGWRALGWGEGGFRIEPPPHHGVPSMWADDLRNSNWMSLIGIRQWSK